MFAANIFETTLPLTNPVLKYLVILLIILFVPIILNRIKVPHLLGLIIAGAIIGPKGFFLIERDSSIVLSGTAGLLYIMFLAGLEIDLAYFNKNFKKSIVFGLLTFTIPITIGSFANYYLLGFSIFSSVLLASMYSSHTLLAYPIISKLGLVKNKAVNITVGGTVITDTLALLVLALIVGMTTGQVNSEFWLRISVSIVIFVLIILFVFPRISRWFFKTYEDNVSQYIFVLAMVFLGAFLAELAGIEAIVGALLTGLSLNRLIARTSPLMNRIEFVGSAVFIPFFLIGVGMLIDFRVFFTDIETIKVAVLMIVTASIAKYLAAWFTQKIYGFSYDQRLLIFGLSNAHAGAMLAAVMVGYNVILGYEADNLPIRLLNESVLNGAILTILFTCTLSTLVAQKGAKNIILKEEIDREPIQLDEKERILIPVSNAETIEELINLGVSIKSGKSNDSIFALSVLNHASDDDAALKEAEKLLEKAEVTASATDNYLHPLLRYDVNIVNGITGTVMENKITDLIMGLHRKGGITDSFLGNLTEGVLTRCDVTTLIYKSVQPIGTLKRQVVVFPPNAEKEIGFEFYIGKIWNMAANTNSKLVVYGTEATFAKLRLIQVNYTTEVTYQPFENWEDFLILKKDIQPNDNFIVVLSRKNYPSYDQAMNKIPGYLNKHFLDNSFILIYPRQTDSPDTSLFDYHNPALMGSMERFGEIKKSFTGIFKSNK